MMNELFIAMIAFAAGWFLARRPWKKAGKKCAAEHSVENEAAVLRHDAKMWNIFSDAMPIHVYIKDADNGFCYLYSNKKRNDFFGLTGDELIGHDDTLILSRKNAEAQLAVDAEIMKKPQDIHEGFIEVDGKDGKKRYFRIAQTPFTEKSGKHLLLGAALDVTEQEESRRELVDAKRRIEEHGLWLARTLKSIGDAVIVTDKYGTIVLMNPVAERLTGVEAGDAVGKPHDEVFHIVGTLDNEPRLSPVNRALRTGAIVELANSTDLISEKGEHYHISDSAAPITDDRNNILGSVLVFRDVTEAYQRRSALRDALNDWEMASSVGGIVSFRMDCSTRCITGSRHLSDFWQIKDGKAVPPGEWMLPEYVDGWDRLFAAVSEGREKQVFFEYCAIKNGHVRRYRLFGAQDTYHPGEITGIIQDITEAYEKETQLRNTRMMWNAFVDILPLHFFAKNADDHFRYIHCNKRFAEFVGKTPGDIIGKTDAELFGHPEGRIHSEEKDRECMRSGKSENFTESALGVQNRPYQFQTVKMPCVGPGGEHLLLGVSIDVTELVSLNKSQTIIRQGLEMLVEETDVNEGIAKAMKLVCEYIGVSRSYILHFDLEKKTVTCVREYCQTGEINLLDALRDIPYSTGVDWPEHFRRECFFNFPDLQNTETLNFLGPFYSKMIHAGDFRSLYTHRLVIDGKFWGYVGFAYEKEMRILNSYELDFVQSAARFIELMIRHKRTQQQLREAVVQANAAEKAKSRFLATMSHEIRTPLNAVIGFSELLKDGSLSDSEKKDYLNDISVAGNALLLLINDILDLSKLEAGKMSFVKTATDFSALVHEIMIVFRQKFKNRQLEEIVKIKDLPLIRIDPLRIRQILFNLVGNAVKFTDSGSISIFARFHPNDNGRTGVFRFSVRDTGCGISEEDSSRLFQPFVQSRSMTGTSKSVAGTGLGLALVRRMLEYMNGEIKLHSKPGVGSEFIVTLHDIEYESVATGVPKKIAVAEKENSHPLFSRTLLVDDVPMNLKVLQAMLRKIGVSTVTASGGQEALSILEKQQMDVLLTDLWMPGMNGMELAQKIRHTGKYPGLHIVAVTADTEAESNFDPQLFDAVLGKPVTIEKLRRCIGRFERKNE